VTPDASRRYSAEAAGVARLQRSPRRVVRIFRGASPGELPIEGPTRFKFAVNVKTAAMLGLTLPQIVLQRADEVIE
jgi:putative ABC transport system substrate-binding protein